MASRRQDPEITVAVDGASWTRVQSLRRAGPDDQVFTVSTEDDGTTEVRFGDGSRGLRPPVLGMALAAASIFGLNRDRPSR